MAPPASCGPSWPTHGRARSGEPAPAERPSGLLPQVEASAARNISRAGVLSPPPPEPAPISGRRCCLTADLRPPILPPPRGRVRRGPFGSAARRTDPHPRSVGTGRGAVGTGPPLSVRVSGQARPWPRCRPLSGAFRPLLPASALCRCPWTGGPAAAQGAGGEDNGYWYKSPSLWLRLKFSPASQGPGLRECQPWGVNPQNPKGFSTLFRALCSKASVLNEGEALSYPQNNGRGGRAAQADRVRSSARYGRPGRPGQLGNREASCALPLSGHTTPMDQAAHPRHAKRVTAADCGRSRLQTPPPATRAREPCPGCKRFPQKQRLPLATRARIRPLSRVARPVRLAEAGGPSGCLGCFFPVSVWGEDREKTSSFFAHLCSSKPLRPPRPAPSRTVRGGRDDERPGPRAATDHANRPDRP